MTRRIAAAGGQQDQRGVALITVLAVIGFTGLVIGALFGLLSTSMRVTDAAERSAREGRAADAAIETAINRMRERPCTGVDQSYLTEDFDQGTDSAADDVSVEVFCSPEDEGGGTDQVRIVGTDSYGGDLAWRTDCAANADEGCLPWSDALGSVPVPGDLDDRNLSLVHAGDRALRFGSGVSVRTGAAALRTDDGSPAIRVGGQYRQGGAGLGASGTDCGVLSGDPGGGRGRIEDVDGDPVCGDDEVRNLPTGSSSRLEAVEPPASIPSCGPAGGVVTFEPGRYSPSQTDAVTALTGGGCPGRTFHFPPGVYEFRGDELVFGDERSYYVFGQPNGWSPDTGLVGTDLGREPDAVLCDTAQPGASIVLNGWTELSHTGGRVAVCPAVPDSGDGSDLEPFDAIQQNPAVPTGVEVTGVRTTGWGNGIDDVDFRCRQVGFFPTTSDYPNGLGGVCRPMRRYDLTLETQGRGPVDSLRVMLTANESESTPNNLVENRETQFWLYNSSGAQLCRTDWFAGAPNGGLTSAYDLRTSGQCGAISLDQGQLDGARIRVDHRMTLSLIGVRQPFTLIDQSVEVNAVSGTPTNVAANGGAGASGYDGVQNVLTDDGSVASPQMPGDCTDFVCRYDDGGTFTTADRFVHEVGLDGFEWPAPFDGSSDIDPQITTLRALVRVTPTASSLPAGLWELRNLLDVENFLIPTRTRLVLTAPSGDRLCMVQGTGMNSDQELAFDLLDPNYAAGEGCTLSANNMSDLEGASLSLQFSLPCLRDHFSGLNRCLRENWLLNQGPIWQFRPPGIEHIRLTTVTDTYGGRSPGASVAIDVTDTPQASAFNVHGRTWLPLSDLTLRWRGGAGAAPIFGGNLVVNGLGSSMAPGADVGVVCCSPPDSRTVGLTARVGGSDRIVARVAFSDVIENPDGSTTYSPGHGVDVLDWRACKGGGCADVVAGVNASPPEEAEPDG